MQMYSFRMLYYYVFTIILYDRIIITDALTCKHYISLYIHHFNDVTFNLVDMEPLIYFTYCLLKYIINCMMFVWMKT